METIKSKAIFKIVLSLIIIVGVWLFGYVYAGFKFVPPHFHANFAMYIHGERIDFSGDDFMEDVAGCGLSELMFPKSRAHLHENNPDTIHIHHEWVAWGHFFLNNDFMFNDNFISLPSWEILRSDEQNKISFLLNGKLVTNPYNDLIKSKDQLIISYGSDENIWELFVSDNAGEYNAKYDPGSCGWTNEGAIWKLLEDLLHGMHAGH